jgi:hypothetical protein
VLLDRTTSGRLHDAVRVVTRHARVDERQ